MIASEANKSDNTCIEKADFQDNECNSSDEEIEILSASESIEQPFYFESDHVALKGNKDYHQLLKIVFILEAQRARAVSDMDTLLTRQTAALADPLAFVQKLQKGEGLNLPRPQQIVELPAIEWENYAIRFDSGKEICDHLHMTRFKKEKDFVEEDNKATITTVSSSIASCGMVVRGRVRNAQKPETFNQLWTAEEQLKLEELLIKYPPEEVESRRYDKIAQELGNRTRQQVASRVQKYFIKLARAGLPVPGRLPSANLCHQRQTKRSRRHRGQKFRPFSTFMVKYEPPVFMPEDEDDTSSMDSYSISQSLSRPPSEHNVQRLIRRDDGMDQIGMNNSTHGLDNESDDEDIPFSLKDTEEYRELQQLKHLRASMLPKTLHDTPSVNQSCISSDMESDDATN